MEKEILNNLKLKFSKEVMERIRLQHTDISAIKEPKSYFQFRKGIETLIKSVLKESRDVRLTQTEQESIFTEIVSDILSLEPIYKLLIDPAVTEIMINGPDEVYVEKEGMLQLADVAFRDEHQLNYLAEQVVSSAGRHLTQLDPYVDAKLSDGSRVNIIRPPVSPSGLVITIRKFRHQIFDLDKLISVKTLDTTAADFLKACVVAKKNIMIAGGSGSGKTTLLNSLASFIPDGERVIVIEDTQELQLKRKHNIFLETRSSNIEGKGEITIKDLLKNSLHMRPDRIIIGEVRSNEVLDMIQAMNTGHAGSMTTLHANSAAEALERLEVLTLTGMNNMTCEVARRQVISAVDLIVHVNRLPDGARKVIRITEMLKGKDYALQDLFVFNSGTGNLEYTGVAPTFYGILKEKAKYFSQMMES